ncbi:MAG: TRAP transporter substrate-binding protein [Pseudomonadota bacterium]
MPSRTTRISRLACVAALLLATLAAPLRAEATTLRYAHFMPAASWQQQTLFLDWAAAVEAASGGAAKVLVFPAQTLGKAPAGFDNAASGVADIAWTVQGYTAGRFPLSQLVELPGLFDTAEIGSCAFQRLYDSGALDAEYEAVKVLYVHTHAPGHLHTATTPVRRLSDLEGLKIRRPTAVIGRLLTELGAEPVGLPAPRIYEYLQRGAIDGYMLPWEAVSGFRVDELTAHRTEFGFYALAFVVAMNRRVYESLSAEARAAIDANSGMKWALTAGRGYDAADAAAAEALRSAIETSTIAEEERAAWEAAAARTREAYLADLDAVGLPGTETYEALKTYVAACEAEHG